MRSILFFLFFLLAAAAQSQRVIDVNKADVDPTRGFFYVVGGEPFSLAKYVKIVDGTPYFSEDWMWGSVIMSNGRRYDSLQLKLDLLANELHFLDIAGNELIASSPVNEVWLTDPVSRTQHRFIHSSVIAVSVLPDPGWYDLLLEGPASFFVDHHKDISEIRPYGSATMEQSIKSMSLYFVSYKNNFTRVKKINELPDLFQDKSADVRKYINSNHLSGKSPADFVRVVSYYNSLPKK